MFSLHVLLSTISKILHSMILFRKLIFKPKFTKINTASMISMEENSSKLSLKKSFNFFILHKGLKNLEPESEEVSCSMDPQELEKLF